MLPALSTYSESPYTAMPLPPPVFSSGCAAPKCRIMSARPLPCASRSAMISSPVLTYTSPSGATARLRAWPSSSAKSVAQNPGGTSRPAACGSQALADPASTTPRSITPLETMSFRFTAQLSQIGRRERLRRESVRRPACIPGAPDVPVGGRRIHRWPVPVRHLFAHFEPAVLRVRLGSADIKTAAGLWIRVAVHGLAALPRYHHLERRQLCELLLPLGAVGGEPVEACRRQQLLGVERFLPVPCGASAQGYK